MKKLGITIIIIVIIFGFQRTAWTAVIRVPADYPIIMDAIFAAAEGDEVIIYPGTYYENNIKFSFKTIAIRSIDPDDPDIVASTIIDGQQMGPVFNLFTGVGNDAVISGLRIRNGWAEVNAGIRFGGGISIHQTSPTIKNNIIENNYAVHSGGGICCFSSAPVIENNIIRNNYAEQFGGGIHCRDSAAIIRDNTITDNHSVWDGGGISTLHQTGKNPAWIDGNNITLNRSLHGAGISSQNATSTSSETDDRILNNYIADNIAKVDVDIHGPCSKAMGGGIYGSPYEIFGNTIINNFADRGGGIHITGDTPITITDNIISNNSAARRGGGIDFRDVCRPVVEYNLISGNRSTKGAGIACYFGTFTNNIISMNQSISDDPEIQSKGGGIYFSETPGGYGFPPNFMSNTVDRNSADDGGNIYISLVSPIIKNCIITNAQSGGGIIRDESGGDFFYPEISFCNLFQNQGENYVGITDQTGSRGNISTDPLFFDPPNNDYHLQSEFGRWTGSSWYEDNITSPCIDIGDPSSEYSEEPSPNGGRINMGAFGNTWEASKSREDQKVRIIVYEISEWLYPILNKNHPDGINIELVGDTSQIIKILQQGPIDVILIDLASLENTGLDTTAFVSEVKSSIKYQEVVIIGFSRDKIKNGLETCLNAGMDDYWVGPDTTKLTN